MTATSEILDRTPPHNADAETAVVGSVLLDPRCLDDLTLRPTDFYARELGTLYGALLALHDARRAIDATTVIDALRHDGSLNAVGGVSRIAEVIQSVATPRHARHYAAIVARDAKLRRLIQAGLDLVRDGYAAAETPEQILAAAETALTEIATGDHEGDPVPAAEAAREMCCHIEAVIAHRKTAGLPIGLYSWDREIGGLFASELSILAARPSQGKSALAMQVAYHVAVAGRGVYFASLEMSRVELLTRLCCGESCVNSRLIRTGTITSEAFGSMAPAVATVGGAALFIHDRPSLSVYEIRRAARKLHRTVGLALVVVDYLQLVAPANDRDSREQQVSKISRGLKALARELAVPVLCLCQLSRAGEQADEPQLSHLRESGAIEQDADVVAFIQRGVKWPGDDAPSDRQAYLLCRKNRNGEVGKYRLNWHPERTRFSDPATETYAEFDSYRGDGF